jgi:hypothetical protein
MNLSEDKRRQARETDLAILAACERQAHFDERKALLSEPQPGPPSSSDASAASGSSTAVVVATPYSAVPKSEEGVEMTSPASPSTPTSSKRFSLGPRRQSYEEEQAIKAGAPSFACVVPFGAGS